MAFLVPFIPLIIGGVGTAVSAIGQIKAGTAAQTAAQQNAQNDIEAAKIQEDQQRLADKRTLATGRADVGASGVELSGSPLDVMAESARQAEMNALIIRRGGQLQAQAEIFAGNAAKTASTFGAAGTILTGAAGAIKSLSTIIPKSKSPSAGPIYGDPVSGPTVG